jgi:hypothetical protein
MACWQNPSGFAALLGLDCWFNPGIALPLQTVSWRIIEQSRSRTALYKARADFVGLSQLDGQGKEKPLPRGTGAFFPMLNRSRNLARLANLPAHQSGQSQEAAAEQGEASRLRKGGRGESGYVRRRDPEIEHCIRRIGIDEKHLDRMVAFGNDRPGA